MAWYFFIFVPSQLQYFVGSRFRTLAVASDQVTGKVDNLKKALDEAATSVGASKENTGPLTKYLGILVPEMQLLEQGRAAPPSALSIPGPIEGLTAAVAWEDIMAQAAAASARAFDDLILADKTGSVVWQREKATPRVGNLSELLSAESAPGGWLAACTGKSHRKNRSPDTALRARRKD
jgi:hypothetical protein